MKNRSGQIKKATKFAMWNKNRSANCPPSMYFKDDNGNGGFEFYRKMLKEKGFDYLVEYLVNN